MKLKTFPVLVRLGAALAVALPMAQSATAAPKPQCDITVHGSGSDPSDAAAVSAAVNGPHSAAEVTVCLAGIFDFGSMSFVPIDPVRENPLDVVEDLEITGLDGATIMGGAQPLRLVSSLPRLSITNLRFVNPTFSAISIFQANERIVIANNEIDGVLSFVLPDFGVALRHGIALSTMFAEIAGTVEITGNVVDGGTYDPVDDLSTVNAGIALFGAFGATTNPFSAVAVVANNEVRNWSGSAIAGIGLSGATIEKNTIEPGAFANRLPAGACAVAAGIGAAAGLSLTGTVDTLVKSNTIDLTQAADGEGDAVCNAGIILLGDNGAGTPDAAGNLFKANKVRGAGSYAVIVGLDTSAAEQNNVFQGNNVSTFAATEASLFLGQGASGNTFKGHFPTAAGNVAENSITGPH